MSAILYCQRRFFVHDDINCATERGKRSKERDHRGNQLMKVKGQK